MGRVTVFSGFVVAALAHLAMADNGPRVAVVPGIAVNLDAAKVDALSQDLAESLSSQLVVDAVGGLEVRRQLPADGLPADCVSNPACSADVAKRTGATQLLFVVMVGGGGGAVQIDTTWIEPGTGKRASRPAVDLTSSTDDAARGKFDSIARTLLPDAAVRQKPVAAPGKLSIDTKMTDGTPRHFTTPSLVAAGGAGAATVAWAVFFFEARSKYNTCESNPVACTGGPRDTIRHWDLAADVSAGLAIGAAVTAGVLYATSGEAPHVIVTPTTEGVTASWLGRF